MMIEGRLLRVRLIQHVVGFSRYRVIRTTVMRCMVSEMESWNVQLGVEIGLMSCWCLKMGNEMMNFAGDGDEWSHRLGCPQSGGPGIDFVLNC